MSEYRTFARRVGLVGFTSILTRLSSLILLPVLTKTLPVEQYGVWAMVWVSIALIPIIASFGLPSAMIRFLAAETEKEEIASGFYSTVFYVSIGAILSGSVVFLYSGELASLVFGGNMEVVRIMAVIVFLECLNRVFLLYFSARQKMRKYSFLAFVKAYSTVGFVTYFVLSGYGIIGAVGGLLISSSILALITSSMIVREIGISFRLSKRVKEYFAFGLPLIPAHLSSWFVNSSDRYIIGLLMGVSFVGYYSPGYALGMLVAMIIAPLGLMLPPALSKEYDNGNLDAVRKILQYSFKYFVAIAVPAVVGLSLLSYRLLVILSTEQIAANAYQITPLIATSALALGLYTILSRGIVLRKRTKITGTIWITAAVVNVGLNIILIPIFGITGAALTTLIAFVIALGLNSYFSLKFVPFEIDFVFLLKSIVASAAMSIPLFLVETDGLIQLMALIIIASAIYFLLLLVMKGIRREEIRFFMGLAGIRIS